jgi:hypothetical protein
MMSAINEPKGISDNGSLLLPDQEEMLMMAPLFFHAPEAFGLTTRYCSPANLIIAGEFHMASCGGDFQEHVLSAGSYDRITAYRQYWSAMKFEIL